MEVFVRNDGTTHVNSRTCSVRDFPSQSEAVGIAIADINGRYPEGTGWAVNHKSSLTAYVLFGKGVVETLTIRRELRPGAMVVIDAGEHYAWWGDLQLFITTAPSWHPDQYEVAEG